MGILTKKQKTKFENEEIMGEISLKEETVGKVNILELKKVVVEDKRKSNERGVTLIALVVTIIILLILAGITIAMLSGDNRNTK